MSDHTDSEPLNPIEANQEAMRMDIDGMKKRMDEMMNMVKLQTQLMSQFSSLPFPTPNPNVASSSQQYVPQTPQPPPSRHQATATQNLPPPIPNPPLLHRSPTPPPFIPHYEPPPPSPRHHRVHEDEGDRISVSHASEEEYLQRRMRPKEDDDRGLRIDLPEYDGNLNPDKYLEWISAMERIFEYKDYSDAKKFKVAILKFTEYAALWWGNIKRQRERDDKEPIARWSKLKKVMDKKFLPKTYKQKLYDKLHSLRQDKKTVTEYIREFDEIKLRCDIPEAREHAIARFIGG